MKITVVYALPDNQILIDVELPEGTTVADAIEKSGILKQFPELASNPVGIFGHIVPRDAILSPNDRIEIYRPLMKDPKEARRQRASSGG